MFGIASVDMTLGLTKPDQCPLRPLKDNIQRLDLACLFKQIILIDT